MSIIQKVANHGVYWEEEFGYSQAFQAGDTLYLSGQLAHDTARNLIGEGGFAKQMQVTFWSPFKRISDRLYQQQR